MPRARISSRSLTVPTRHLAWKKDASAPVGTARDQRSDARDLCPAAKGAWTSSLNASTLQPAQGLLGVGVNPLRHRRRLPPVLAGPRLLHSRLQAMQPLRRCMLMKESVPRIPGGLPLAKFITCGGDAARASADSIIPRLHPEGLLPKGAQLRRLSDLFFARVHTLRSLGFIYKPAWMQSLDRGRVVDDFGEPLVLMVCALGARCLFRDEWAKVQRRPRARPSAPVPGTQWASKAESLIVASLTKPAVHNLMVR